MDEYYRLGGRTLDTAHAYGKLEGNGVSHAERVIGKWISTRGVRNKITLITKGAHPPAGDLKTSRVTPECLNSDFEESIELLGVDYVDVFFIHRDDETLPVSLLIDTMDVFVKQGKVLALGASNWSIQRIIEANDYAIKNGKTPFTVSQIQWSLASCTPDGWGDDGLLFMDYKMLDGYQQLGIPVMAFSSQARGLFSKYIADPENAITKRNDFFFTPENVRKIEAVRTVCAEYNASPAAVCLAYVTSYPMKAGASALIGSSSLEQLVDSMSGMDLTLRPETIKMLDNA